MGRMLQCRIPARQPEPTCRPSKPDIPPDWRSRVPMENLFFVALAALSLGVATVPAFAHSTVADDAARYRQTGAL
jgi:hypothetical protein